LIEHPTRKKKWSDDLEVIKRGEEPYNHEVQAHVELGSTRIENKFKFLTT